MASRDRKYAPFTVVPEDVPVITVEDEPDRGIPVSDYPMDKKVKEEPEEDSSPHSNSNTGVTDVANKSVDDQPTAEAEASQAHDNSNTNPIDVMMEDLDHQGTTKNEPREASQVLDNGDGITINENRPTTEESPNATPQDVMMNGAHGLPITPTMKKSPNTTPKDVVVIDLIDDELDEQFGDDTMVIHPESDSVNQDTPAKIKQESQDDIEKDKSPDTEMRNSSSEDDQGVTERQQSSESQHDPERQPSSERPGSPAPEDLENTPDAMQSETPREPVRLGNSCLAPRRRPIGGAMTSEEVNDLLKQQREMAQTLRARNGIAGYQREFNDEEEVLPNWNQLENPWAMEAEYERLKEVFERKDALGQATPVEATEFFRIESRYNAQKEQLRQLLNEQTVQDLSSTQETHGKRKRGEEGSDSTETSSSRKSKKKPKPKKSQSATKRKASRKQQQRRTQNFGQSNLFEDVDAAERLGQQPAFSASNNKQKAFQELMKNVPEEFRADAARDWKRLQAAWRNFTNRESLKPSGEGLWRLKGMKTHLQPHQVISAGFMRGRESGDEMPRGGIIGDQMGLGKTVVALANIINGKPSMQEDIMPGLSYEECPQTTLIVVPSPLLKQWYREIQLHCEQAADRSKWGIGTVRIFRDKESDTTQPQDLHAADIVLTTYWDVMRSWPKPVFPEGLPANKRTEYWEQHLYPTRGLLHRIKFFRIVLDEGHTIRNPTSHTTQGTLHLEADHHWTMSGTIMVNGSQDFYSQFNFIRHPEIHSCLGFTQYKAIYCDAKDTKSMSSMSEDLLDCISRFSHADRLFAARLVTLPKARYVTVRTKFFPLERAIYQIVGDRFRERARTIDEDGTEKSKYMNFLAFLTLMRQLSAHPLMVTSSEITEYLAIEDYEKLDKVIKKEESKMGQQGEHMIRHLRQVIRQQRIQAEEEPALRSQGSATSPAAAKNLSRGGKRKSKKSTLGTGGSHGKGEELASLVQSFKRTVDFHMAHNRAECCVCKGPAVQPLKAIPCHHYYCTPCLLSHFHKAGATGQTSMRGLPLCAHEDCYEEIDGSESLNSEDAIFPKWLSTKGEVFPSAKTYAVKSQILEWLDPISGDPDCKIIVFTLWHGMINILSRIFQMEGWGFTLLHGKMSHKARDNSIARFKGEKNVKILLATMFTGGVGLNLTEGSRVILTDPYWNTAAEEQAFSRVFRIGQKKETDFTKVTVQGSVDDRLQRIKARKDVDIEMTLRNMKAHELHSLMEELTAPMDDTDDEPDDSVFC